MEASSRACANIALIKYWGKKDEHLHIPLNNSISFNLAALETRTFLSLEPNGSGDITLNDEPAPLDFREKVIAYIHKVYKHLPSAPLPPSKITLRTNNTLMEGSKRHPLPGGIGLASSASGFAALTVAILGALQIELNERETSALARIGSGSACRSIPGGFVEWHAGNSHDTSFAESFCDERDIAALIVVNSTQEKSTSSRVGMQQTVKTSPFLKTRLTELPSKIKKIKGAIVDWDFETVGSIAENDALEMHACMLTTHPPLLYWNRATVSTMECVWMMREREIPVYFTIDAGPNVVLLTPAKHLSEVKKTLTEENLTTPDLLIESNMGPGACLVKLE